MAAAGAAPRRKARTRVDWFLTVIRVAVLVLVAAGLLAFIAQEINPDNPFARWANPDATGLTGAQFRGLVVSGVSQGAMYGLIALGYSMVYGVLGFINFAHGEVFMVGAMTGMITSTKLADAGLWESNFVGSLVFILIVSVIVSTLMAVVMERVAYRPLRGAPRLIPLTSDSIETACALSAWCRRAMRYVRNWASGRLVASNDCRSGAAGEASRADSGLI